MEYSKFSLLELLGNFLSSQFITLLLVYESDDDGHQSSAIEVYIEIEILIEVAIEILIANLQFNEPTFATNYFKVVF